jgi:1-acyl-sn-glycerol-3-phosphate acyltransferase
MISKLFVWLCVRWFRLSGWHAVSYIPKSVRHYVLVVAPHTTNVDFFVGIAARKVLRLKVRFVAKKEIFRFPVKNLLLNLGGFPVDRSKNGSLVEQMTGYYKDIDDFSICVTPEGTRSKVESWKTGFYHIALSAGAPIIMVGLDYQRKWVVVSAPFMPSGDREKDFHSMRKFFGKITPKYPENYSY